MSSRLSETIAARASLWFELTPAHREVLDELVNRVAEVERERDEARAAAAKLAETAEVLAGAPPHKPGDNHAPFEGWPGALAASAIAQFDSDLTAGMCLRSGVQMLLHYAYGGTPPGGTVPQETTNDTH